MQMLRGTTQVACWVRRCFALCVVSGDSLGVFWVNNLSWVVFIISAENLWVSFRVLSCKNPILVKCRRPIKNETMYSVILCMSCNLCVTFVTFYGGIQYSQYPLQHLNKKIKFLKIYHKSSSLMLDHIGWRGGPIHRTFTQSWNHKRQKRQHSNFGYSPHSFSIKGVCRVSVSGRVFV